MTSMAPRRRTHLYARILAHFQRISWPGRREHPVKLSMTGDLVRGHTTLGDLDLTILTDGTYLLDGGAMFGVVPKTLVGEARARQ